MARAGPLLPAATIPTVLGINESARLIRALRRERIPCRRIVVNQLLSPEMGARCVCMGGSDVGFVNFELETWGSSRWSLGHGLATAKL